MFSNENFQDSLIWRRLTLQKSILPKSHQPNPPNSAKMLKKLCLINDDVTYCLVEKKTGKAKLWRSICLVMKKKFQPHLTSFDPSKNRINKIALKMYFRKNWGTKSVFSHYVHKLVRKSTFHILYINLFKIHCFWFFQQNFVLKFGWNLTEWRIW